MKGCAVFQNTVRSQFQITISHCQSRQFDLAIRRLWMIPDFADSYTSTCMERILNKPHFKFIQSFHDFCFIRIIISFAGARKTPQSSKWYSYAAPFNKIDVLGVDSVKSDLKTNFLYWIQLALSRESPYANIITGNWSFDVSTPTSTLTSSLASQLHKFSITVPLLSKLVSQLPSSEQAQPS